MGVGAEMRIDFHFLQAVSRLLHLGAVPGSETAEVGLEGATKVNQIGQQG